jgi:DNA-binding MarR family transcriptional regulator
MRTDDPHRPEIAAGGPALFRLVRFWSRRWAVEAGRAPTGDVADVGNILVLEAIDAALAHGSAAIADVAMELGLDRSNASRMLATAVSAGLVSKTIAASDARRTELHLTAEGRSKLTAARAWQGNAFLQMTAGWPSRDARRFAAYLQRLAAQELSAEGDRPADQ